MEISKETMEQQNLQCPCSNKCINNSLKGNNYYDHTKADNSAYTGKIQISCVILDFARLKDKLCYSQEVKMFFTESLKKDKKKSLLLDLDTDTKSAKLIKEKRVLLPALKNRRNY